MKYEKNLINQKLNIFLFVKKKKSIDKNKIFNFDQLV